METQVYIEYYLKYQYFRPGMSYAPICSPKEIPTRDPRKLEVPESAHCFWVYNKLFGVAIVDGQQVPFESDEFNRSPRYFIGAKIYTVEDLEREFPQKKGLIETVGTSYDKRIIRCRTGYWEFPIRSDDIFIDEVK
jgi:hypothetical protein